MSDITETARVFFDAVETGKGWEGCRAWCTPDAGFSAQTEPLAEIRTLADYAEWMKGLLVFVPDGALRTVPLGALHDGEQYLVARHAVAVTPGLSLVDPRPLEPEGARLLLAGLSEATQGFPELPNTERELEAIHALYGGQVLLNEAFAAERFERELAAEQPTIVHVASHAVFNGDPAESFLLTHDGRLTLDAISDAMCGGFGAGAPFTLVWDDHRVARRCLGVQPLNARPPTFAELLDFLRERRIDVVLN